MYVQLNGWIILIIIVGLWVFRTFKVYHKKQHSLYKDWPLQMFFLYFLAVGYLTMRPFYFQIPFTAREFSFDTNLFYNLLHMADGYLAYQLLYSIGNIMLFIPLGFLLPLLNKKCHSIILVTIIGFTFSLSIEMTQATFTLTRFGTVDDLVFNTFGALIGILIFKVLNFLTNRLVYFSTYSTKRN